MEYTGYLIEELIYESMYMYAAMYALALLENVPRLELCSFSRLLQKM